MSVTAQITKAHSLGGLSYTEQRSISGSGQLSVNLAMSLAQPGTIGSVSGNAGTVTMTNSGHGITTGARVDVYWSGGQRYGVTVGTVSGTSVPLTSSGGGTSLPANGTAVTVVIPVSEPLSFVGNNINVLLITNVGVEGSLPAQITIADSGNLLNVALNPNTVYQWYVNSGVVNPLAGATPTQIWLSSGDATNVATLSVSAQLA